MRKDYRELALSGRYNSLLVECEGFRETINIAVQLFDHVEYKCVDFVNRRLKVNKSQQDITGMGISITPKTETSVRDILMPEVAYDALIEHRQNTMGRERYLPSRKGPVLLPTHPQVLPTGVGTARTAQKTHYITLS